MIRKSSNRGSILIWTLLLGVAMTTVFFFFAQRLSRNAEQQRETIQYQNARVFVESYADYLESLTSPVVDDAINYEGITGSITNIIESKTGAIDVGGETTFNVTENGGIVILEWNLCNPAESGRIIEINDVESANDDDCADDYENSINLTPDDTYKLEAPYTPISYRITSTGDAVLAGPEWQLDLSYTLPSGQTINVSRTWTPSP